MKSDGVGGLAFGSEVATGMTSAAGELRPVFGNRQALCAADCAQLGTRGLPQVSRKQSFSAKTRLADWVATDATRYFGDCGGIEPLRHRVWSFSRRTKSGEVQVLVPALALMRALLRPHSYVLAQMFQPHALDLVCTFINRAPRPTRPWPRARTSVDSPPFVGAMTWMHCFPSARRAANSIYERARDGWLDIELPQAAVELHLSGVARGQNFFVTQLTVSAIEAEEEPFPFADDAGRRVHLRAARRFAELPTLDSNSEAFSFSDEELHLIAPFIAGARVLGHAPWEVVDSLLAIVCDVAPSITSNLVDKKVRQLYKKQLANWRANGLHSQVEATFAQIRSRLSD